MKIEHFKKLLLIFTLTSIICLSFTYQGNFLVQQKKYPRVKTAFSEKGAKIDSLLKKKGIAKTKLNLLLVAYKHEAQLEVYVKNKTDKSYQKFATYEICASSGELGPKRQQGDGQVPEGFYYIDRYNPTSTYHLSLGVSYPNQADRIKSTAKDLGGDIFIHGECVTIGCLPMTNDKIKEIYLLAIQARNTGQLKIPVYIFPFRMNETNTTTFFKKYKDHKALLAFWTNLKEAHQLFDNQHQELKLSVSKNGDYSY